MKKNWVRLASMCKQGSEKERSYKFNWLFLKHHHNADEIIYSVSGKEVLCAVYFSPEAKNREELKRIMRLIQERMHYACELLPDNSSKE